MLLDCTERTRLMLDVYKITELSCWISWFKWNKTIWSLVLVNLIILKASVIHKITNLKQLFIALSWTVLFVCGTEMCLVDRFVYVLVIVSPFCRNIPWVEVDLATWATEKKTISHFSLSFMYWFGVNLGCDTHSNHCSHVAANVLLKMGLAWWPYSCYRKFNIKLFDLMPKESRESASHTTWLVSISFPSHWHLSCFQLCFQSNYWLQYIVDLYSTNNGL